MRTPRWALKALGRGFAAYLRLVRRTSRMTLDPPDLFDRRLGLMSARVPSRLPATGKSVFRMMA